MNYSELKKFSICKTIQTAQTMKSVLTLILASLSLLNAFECGGSNATAISPFDLTEYLGIWYQIAVTKTFDTIFEHDLYCVYANYTIDPEDSSTVIVTNTGYKGGPNGTLNVAVGSATQSVPDTGLSFIIHQQLTYICTDHINQFFR